MFNILKNKLICTLRLADSEEVIVRAGEQVLLNKKTPLFPARLLKRGVGRD